MLFLSMIRPAVCTSTALVLLFLGWAAPAAARRPINAAEALEPARGLADVLGEVHRQWEMRIAGATVADRAIAAYLHHVADDARVLSEALERGRIDDEELTVKISHLEGWFRYVEARLSRSMIGTSLRDDWSRSRSRLRTLQGVGLRLLGSADATEEDSRRRTALDQQRSFPVEPDFERVVEREVKEGKVDLTAHRADGPAKLPSVSPSPAPHTALSGHAHQTDDKHGHNRGGAHNDGAHSEHDHQR